MIYQTQSLSLARRGGQSTNWHRRTQEPWKPSRLATGNMSQPITHFPSRFLLYLASSCEGHPAGVRSTTQTEGIFIPKQRSVETPAEAGVAETGEKWEYNVPFGGNSCNCYFRELNVSCIPCSKYSVFSNNFPTASAA